MPVPDIKNDPNIETRVMIVPEAALQEASSENVQIIKLRHPKTETGSSFLLNPSNKRIFELMSFEEDHRSWFIGSKVVSDGRIFLTTPVNPVFLALPYLVKAEKLVPLDQMLEDSEFPLTEEVLIAALDEKLEVIADRKGDKDLNVWKYNEEKALEWLTSKVKSLGKMLEKQGIDVTGGATSNIYRHTESSSATSVDYLRYGLGIIEEYLSQDLAKKLEVKLELPEEEKIKGEKGNKRLSLDQGSNTPNKKKMKIEGPTEDYSKGSKKVEVKEELSAKQKALATSAKGTKSIMSFFSKK